MYSYINVDGNWKNLKLCEKNSSTQLLIFPISICADITVFNTILRG